MRITRCLCWALVAGIGFVLSACAAEPTPVPGGAQPSVTEVSASAVTVPGAEVPEPEATTASTSATTETTVATVATVEPVEGWTPQQALAVLSDVCAQPLDGRGSFEDWTPKFWLLCNVVAVGPSGGVPDMWGFNAECEDLPDLESALGCVVHDLVNYMIIDYQILESGGDLSETWWLGKAAQADLAERCERLVSSVWGDDEDRERCAGYLASLLAVEPAATADALEGDAIGFGPAAGDRLVVAGVESDDVLNVRDEPMGTIVAMLEIIRGETDERLWVLRPDSSVAAYLEDDAVVATGRARSLGRSTWYEITVGGYTGWASAAYLAYPAAIEDVTDEVTQATGAIPQAATIDELAQVVIEALGPRLSGEPVTVSGPGWFEGLAEVEIDFVVRGSRHFGQRLYIAAAGIDWDGTHKIIDTTLRSVSLQSLCTRGWNGQRCF